MRQRDRETERQRDRETERQRDRETERQRDRETERDRDIAPISMNVHCLDSPQFFSVLRVHQGKMSKKMHLQ